jgi:hypothetical protein
LGKIFTDCDRLATFASRESYGVKALQNIKIQKILRAPRATRPHHLATVAAVVVVVRRRLFRRRFIIPRFFFAFFFPVAPSPGDFGRHGSAVPFGNLLQQRCSGS